MIIISAEKDSISVETDDLANEISYTSGNTNCTFKITNTKPISILKGNTIQITTSPTVSTRVFESSDPSIATVSSSGLITALAEGNVTVTAYRSTNSFFKDTIQVAVALPDMYSLSVDSPKTILDYMESVTVTNTVSNNGRPVDDAAVTYDLLYSDRITLVPDTVAALGNITNRSVTIQNRNNEGQMKDIVLRVTLVSDSTQIQYVPFNLAYYIAPNYSVVIFTGHQPPNEVEFGDNVFLGRVVYNNGIQDDTKRVTWSLVGIDKISDVPENIAKITFEDSFNQVYVNNYNETGTDTTIYVKVTLDGFPEVTDYYMLNIKSKVIVITKSVDIGRADGAAMLSNTFNGTSTDDTINYQKTINYRSNAIPANEAVTWTLTNFTGGSPATGNSITVQDGFTCTVRAGNAAAGIKLTAKMVSDPTVIDSILIRVKSLL
ncbi:hypothetical protein FFV09_02210 [Saccharibacillus brassicae]|uniref:BIG2 domain-containing protein n=2 Tax=Saccharibacillus brassicae TaxID=2583377 RepID=A0A4Y6V413_SACBS|nr:hypothetical protein FFV09_02210 [Saccharibacillus brassicae]